MRKKTNAFQVNHRLPLSPPNPKHYASPARATTSMLSSVSSAPRASGAFAMPRRATLAAAAARKASLSPMMLAAKPVSSTRPSLMVVRAAIAEPQAPSKATGGSDKLKIGINGVCLSERETSAVCGFGDAERAGREHSNARN